MACFSLRNVGHFLVQEVREGKAWEKPGTSLASLSCLRINSMDNFSRTPLMEACNLATGNIHQLEQVGTELGSIGSAGYPEKTNLRE